MVFGLFGGAGVEITIEIDRPDGAYALGDGVGASITLAAEKGSKVREVRAGLVRQDRYQVIDRRRDSDGDVRDNYQWQTKETWVTREVLLHEGSLPSGFNESYRFEWTLPSDAPPSCGGDIVQVKWLVKVTVDRPMARDENKEVEIRVLTPATGQYAQAGDYGQMNTSSGVMMQLALPTLELIEGETIEGRLLIDPSQRFDAREVRVELVREERVNPGDRVNVKQRSVHKLQLARDPKLEPGTPVELDFSLPVPSTGAPSHDAGDTVVTWMLVGTIDRPMRGDYTVTQWVGVYNS